MNDTDFEDIQLKLINYFASLDILRELGYFQDPTKYCKYYCMSIFPHIRKFYNNMDGDTKEKVNELYNVLAV